jgi:predicted transcriptional regulator of viral defense system
MNKKDLLFQIADRQQGYFTSLQAEECGFLRFHFQRYILSGEWMREQRGIYRLSRYPVTDRPELVLWSLWSRNKEGKVQGVWSHETALDIYELCDVMPSKMHMTVPKFFRKSTSISPLLILHYSTLSENEVRSQQGYLITTPLRTLIDIAEEGSLSHDFLMQALKEALRRGILSRRDIENTPAACKLKVLLDEIKI